MVRGPDWSQSEDGDKDGRAGGTVTGTAAETSERGGYVAVRWDNGNTGTFRMGARDRFELTLEPAEGGAGGAAVGGPYPRPEDWVVSTLGPSGRGGGMVFLPLRDQAGELLFRLAACGPLKV